MVDRISRAVGAAGLVGVALTGLTAYALVALGGTTGTLALGAVALAIALAELAACWLLYTESPRAHEVAVVAFALGAVLAFLGGNVAGVTACALIVLGAYWRR